MQECIAIHILYTSCFPIVVDVSAQSCTITPTSPDDLDPTGGVIVDGTVNVMIECRCGGRVRWFYRNTTRIVNQANTPPGDPFFIPAINLATLVIPIFNDTTDGIYTCGLGNTYPPNDLATINLILPGKDIF